MKKHKLTTKNFGMKNIQAIGYEISIMRGIWCMYACQKRRFVVWSMDKEVN